MHTRVFLLTCLILLTVTAVDGCHSAAPDETPYAWPYSGPGSEARSRSGTPLAEAVQEIQRSSVPEGITPELFEQLRGALAAVVQQRLAEQDRMAGRARSTSSTPLLNKDQVQDLTLANGTGEYLLSWRYRNTGDYDLNGEVNISDLTPVGLYFGQTSASPSWNRAQLADGDGNGEVNIADITPIGSNYFATILGYEVWGTTALNADWELLGTVGLDALGGEAAVTRIIVGLPQLDYTFYRIWPYDNSTSQGGWSNIAWLGHTTTRKMDHIINLF
jgi:hypothetical protein